mmetsp:Transcript_29965/g.61670  ORF Transcript_29965/g.61670 Transcript_29965/m.61670 type:complete len:86 (-) Transcript_29965:607-864(-)
MSGRYEGWRVHASGVMTPMPGGEDDPECECRWCFAHVPVVRLRAIPCGHMIVVCYACVLRRAPFPSCLVCQRAIHGTVTLRSCEQ